MSDEQQIVRQHALNVNDSECINQIIADEPEP